MEAFNVLLAVLFCVCLPDVHECCPIINIDRTSGSDANGHVTVTTILQSDQVREIFENVSNTILDQQEARFVRFLKLHDISARPKDCQDVETMGYTSTRVYTIYPTESPDGFPVRCDMDTDGGGWTVIQRRVNGTTDFYRTWNQYQVGFGNPAHEYWFGNQQIHVLTAHAWYELRIDMTDMDGNSKFVKYNIFSLSDSANGYMLYVDGFYTESEMDDDLSYHSGSKFSTHDRDLDSNIGNCAQVYSGAWWYKTCLHVQLNGKYGAAGWAGIHWKSWTGSSESLARTEMKIRRYTK